MGGGAVVWQEVGAGVHVRRHHNLDLNCGLVCGSNAALVVDTRCHGVEARELLDAVRSITALPLVVVNTHAHFDHCFGNHTFLPAPLWGHAGCATELRVHGEAQRLAMMRSYPSMAGYLDAVEIVPPDHLVDVDAVVELGGRTVHLVFAGRGHTEHDLSVVVPSARCIFAGDLLESGAPPAYDDAWPLDWPSTVDALLDHSDAAAFVPGHGAVMTRADASAQREELRAMASLCAAVARREIDADAAVRRAPFPPATAQVAIARALRVTRP